MMLAICCVVMLVNQISMSPVGHSETAMSRSENLVTDQQKILNPIELLDKTEILMRDLENVKQRDEVLPRVRRQVITMSGCPDGMVKVYVGRIYQCLTCDDYEDKTDKDCPIDKENEIDDD